MFEYARKTYGVPAELGRQVTVDGKPGVIVADRGHYLGICFDDDKPGVVSNCHPTWRVVYGEIVAIRKPTRSQIRYQAYRDMGDCFSSFIEFCRWYDAKRSG